MRGNKSPEISSKELLKMLGDNFKKRIEETPLEKYEEYYKRLKVAEMKRNLMISKAIKEEQL